MIFVNMQSSLAVGISLPKEIVSRIDTERGDIPRSRYLLRLLERVYCNAEYRAALSYSKKEKRLSKTGLRVVTSAGQSKTVNSSKATTQEEDDIGYHQQ
jgi:hypothetical protein